MITVKPVSAGEVYLLQDQKPTPGSTGKHNYIIASASNNQGADTEYVLCFGITSCKNGVYEDMIPILSSNKYTAFINTQRIYTFRIADICNYGTYHGCVDNDTSILIAKLMAIKVGYDNSDKEAVIKSLNGVKVVNGKIVEDKEKNKKEVRVDTDSIKDNVPLTPQPTAHPTTPQPTAQPTTPQPTAQPTTPQRKRQIRISKIETRDLISLLFLIENNKIEKVMANYGLKKETIMAKKEGVKTELDKRVNAFSKNALTYKTKPEFWDLADLYLFNKKYKSADGYSVLCQELGITQPQALDIFRNMKKYMEAKIS